MRKMCQLILTKSVTTIGNGRVLMKDREILVADTEKVMAECRAEAEKLWTSING